MEPTVTRKRSRSSGEESDHSTDLIKAENEIVSSIKKNNSPPEALCNSARTLWISAKSKNDLLLAERLYKRFFSYVEKVNVSAANSNGSLEGYTDLCFVDEQKMRLILLLTQMADREKEVQAMLKKEGYLARLARNILDYPTLDSLVVCPDGKSNPECPCVAVDNVLNSQSLTTLQSVFVPRDADYWTRHDYCVEPPSPFFSYVIPFSDAALLGPLGELALTVKATAEKHFPNAPRANYGEVWAHNRPHAVGHQLHFDSDDEGRGGIRNPTLGSIFYLSGGVGGPSLVTDQGVGCKELASKGWLCQPKCNRLVVFNGKMLHGVIPGKGVVQENALSNDGENSISRVTLMVALWPDIKIRREKKPGSARPLPPLDSDHKWLNTILDFKSNKEVLNIEPKPSVTLQPESISPVWERPDGTAWPAGAPIPHYDTVFQGF